jgi:hypothetical protein
MIERTTRNELSSGFRNRPLGHCHFPPIEILKSRNLTSIVWIVSTFQDLESGPGVRTYQKQGNLSLLFSSRRSFLRTRMVFPLPARSLRGLRFRVLLLHHSGWSDIAVIFSWALARFWYNIWWISSHFDSLLSDRSGSGSVWWWLQRAWLFRLFPPQPAERKVQLARFYPFPWFAAVCEGWCCAVVVASGPWLLLHASVVFWKLDVHFFEVHKRIFSRSAIVLCFPVRFFQALLVREVSFFPPSELCVDHFVFAVLNKQCYLLRGLEALLLLFFVSCLLATRSPVSAGWRSHDFSKMSRWLLVPASIWRKIGWKSVIPFFPFVCGLHLGISWCDLIQCVFNIWLSADIFQAS